METLTQSSVADNLRQINDQIAAAATMAGRDPEDVKLVAVSKTKPIELIKAAKDAGQLIFGENRAQEMQAKNEQLSDVKWHMVGHMQRNKVKYLIDYVDLIHSVDSVRLLKEIDKRAEAANRVVDVLLQVNISDEDQKHGAGKKTLHEMLEAHQDLQNVHVHGLMGMAAFTDDEATLHRQFSHLRELLEEIKNDAHERFSPDELSMGMSGDFPIAIAEGSTMVRIGSAIFGSRK
ncbi:MAG: YggS family pyridoxal phosphate-dependent enzyme [Bacteroidota bacterium]